MTTSETATFQGNGAIVCERDFELSVAADDILRPRVDAMILCRMTGHVLFVTTNRAGRRVCTCGAKGCAHVRAAGDAWVMSTVRRAQLATCNRRGYSWYPLQLFAFLPDQVMGHVWHSMLMRAKNQSVLLNPFNPIRPRWRDTSLPIGHFGQVRDYAPIAAMLDESIMIALSMHALLALGGGSLSRVSLAQTPHARSIRLRDSGGTQ